MQNSKSQAGTKVQQSSEVEVLTSSPNNAKPHVSGSNWSDWQTELVKLKDCPQRQDSTQEQLKDLYKFACKLGFYDAADFLKSYCR
jgi:hypothetical protein